MSNANGDRRTSKLNHNLFLSADSVPPPLRKSLRSLTDCNLYPHRVHPAKHFLEKGGIPVAAILDIDEFEDWLETKDLGLKDQISRGYKGYKKRKAVPLDRFLAQIQTKKKK